MERNVALYVAKIIQHMLTEFGLNIHLQIWNKTVSANSFILNIFLVAAFNATGYANFSIVELDRPIKG